MDLNNLLSEVEGITSEIEQVQLIDDTNNNNNNN